MTDLAHKAVSLPRWRWMAGMRASYEHPDATPDRVSARVHALVLPWMAFPAPVGTPYCWVDGEQEMMIDALPDLTDPATLGCVLALVREAYGDPNAYVEQDATSAAVMANGQYVTSECATEAEALIAALEAAP